MRFRINGTEYVGSSALDIVEEMRRDAAGEGHGCQTTFEFLRRAHAALRDRVPAREIDVSHRLSDDTIALNYLFLCDEYGVGELVDGPRDARTHTA